jgi:hypothetical protein
MVVPCTDEHCGAVHGRLRPAGTAAGVRVRAPRLHGPRRPDYPGRAAPTTRAAPPRLPGPRRPGYAYRAGYAGGPGYADRAAADSPARASRGLMP